MCNAGPWIQLGSDRALHLTSNQVTTLHMCSIKHCPRVHRHEVRRSGATSNSSLRRRVRTQAWRLKTAHAHRSRGVDWPRTGLQEHANLVQDGKLFHVPLLDKRWTIWWETFPCTLAWQAVDHFPRQYSSKESRCKLLKSLRSKRDKSSRLVLLV
jgi:hypothetical protein